MPVGLRPRPGFARGWAFLRVLAWIFVWAGAGPAGWLGCSTPAVPTATCVQDSDCPKGRCLAGICADPALGNSDATQDGLANGSDASGDAGPDVNTNCSADLTCVALLGTLPSCRTAACVDGRCSVVALADAATCTAGSGNCTAPGACKGGQCTATAPLCDDGNPCTLDTCTALGCLQQNQPDGSSCSAGADPCQAAMCTKGQCIDTVSSGYCRIGALCVKEGASEAGEPCKRCVPLANQLTWTTVDSGLCDDGDACTQGELCDIQGNCSGKPLICPDLGLCSEPACDSQSGCVDQPVEGSCSDGNPCTVGDSCGGGTCKAGAPLDCDDANPCTTDSCAVGFGCLHAPASGPCFADNDPCTIDTCKSGYCQAVPESSVCQIGGVCVPANASAAGQPCLVCKPSENASQWTLLDNKACDDGNACTMFESCSAGKCLGQPMACLDNNPCTLDSCESSSGCLFLPIDATCTDANACTINDTCVFGKCSGAALDSTACDDGTPCTTDSCDSIAGCTHKPNNAPCSDGEPCTKGDQCASGECLGGAVICPCQDDLSCSDGNPCTEDVCTSGGCKNSAKVGEPCDDGDACTAQDSCAGSWCSGVAVTCDDKNPCTSEVCVAEKGCLSAPILGKLCNDGNACTTGDVCLAGSCSGQIKGCDDGNPCTFDVCSASSGTCDHAPLGDGSSCPDDGVACTLDTCASGACTHGKVSSGNCLIAGTCLSGGALHPADVCLGCLPKVSQTGWSVRSGLSCSDGNACTVGDLCSGGGACEGQAKACSDGNLCTADFCNPQQIGSEPCFWVPASGACNDGNPCTTADQCNLGKCQGLDLACDDGNPCTLDGCALATGCSHDQHPSGYACPDDGLSCTADACKAGKCTHAPNGNFCVINQTCISAGANAPGQACSTCQPAKDSSAWTPASGGGCDDGNPCTVQDVCGAGQCGAGPATPCDDENPCTADQCSLIAGCSHQPLSGTACEDGTACTSGDSCLLGKCVGQAISCQTSAANIANCQQATCDPAVGCVALSVCPALHECIGGTCLTATAGVAGPVKLPLDNPAAAMPSVAWQEAPPSALGAAPWLWIAAQQGPCSAGAGGQGLAILQLPNAGAPPLQLNIPGASGSCAAFPALLVHPTSYTHLGLYWLQVDTACPNGRSNLAVLSGAQPSMAGALACGPVAGGAPAVQLLSAGADLANPTAVSAALARTSSSGFWAASGTYGDAWLSSGALGKPMGMTGSPATATYWGRPALKVTTGGAAILAPAQLAPQAPGTTASATLQLAAVAANGAIGPLSVAAGPLDVLGDEQTYHAVEAAWDADGGRLGAVISGTLVQAGALRAFLAFARIAPGSGSPATVGVLQWPEPVTGKAPHIHAFRIADVPGSGDFVVAWLGPDGSGLNVARVKPLNDKKFVLQSTTQIDTAALPTGSGAPILGHGGLSELVLAPKGDRFTLVWQTNSGLAMITAPLPK